MAAKPSTVESKAALARVFGVTVQAVNKWSGNGMPEGPPYNTGEVFKWQLAYQRTVWEAQSGTAAVIRQKERLGRANVKKAQEGARKLRRLNDEAEGQLVYKVDVVSMLKSLGTEFRLAAESFGANNKIDMGGLVDIFEARVKKNVEDLRRVNLEEAGDE